MSISIMGIGAYIPKGRISNDEIVDRFRGDFGKYLTQEELDFLLYSFKRKLDFLEIETRSYCESYEEENSVTMAVSASKEAMCDAGVLADEIDLLLFTGLVNPCREPSYAILLAHLLGMEDVNCFDISDTCNGFLKSIEVAQMYIQTGKAKKVLLVTSESTMELLDATRDNFELKTVEEADYIMSTMFAGSGAAAMVVGEDNGKHVIHAYKEKQSTADWDISFLVSPHMQIPAKQILEDRKTIWSDGRKIGAAIIKDMPVFTEQFLEQEKIEIDNVRYIFCHQLGRNISYALLKKLNVDIEKVFPVNTFKECGNMASANIPIGLAIARKQNLLQTGDSILLLGSSCGIKYTAVHIIW